jgi:hypothetical protein
MLQRNRFRYFGDRCRGDIDCEMIRIKDTNGSLIEKTAPRWLSICARWTHQLSFHRCLAGV